MRRSKRAHVPFLHRAKLRSGLPWVKVDFTRTPEEYYQVQIPEFGVPCQFPRTTSRTKVPSGAMS